MSDLTIPMSAAAASLISILIFSWLQTLRLRRRIERQRGEIEKTEKIFYSWREEEEQRKLQREFCCSCGGVMPATAIFCRKCGRRLTAFPPLRNQVSEDLADGVQHVTPEMRAAEAEDIRRKVQDAESIVGYLPKECPWDWPGRRFR